MIPGNAFVSDHIYVSGLLRSCFLAVISFDGDWGCALWVERWDGVSRFFPTIVKFCVSFFATVSGPGSGQDRQQGQNATNGEARD